MKYPLHIVITGGHHNSALVVARELIKANAKVSWIGHRRASHGDQNDSAEYLEVKNAQIPFHNLVAGKFTLQGGCNNIINIPLGVYRAYRYLSTLKPDAVVSFGGYLGFAVGISASLMGIPLYLHEQTVVTGISNQILSFLSRRTFLTWDSSLGKLSQDKAEVVGLPLRESIINAGKTKLFDNSLPTILVMGGKQGSHVINKLIFKHLQELLYSYNLIHQTGMSSATGDYQEAKHLQELLPAQLSSRYIPHGYIGENEVGHILGGISCYIGRSGAHISYELGVLGIASILIPYLHTHQREQLLNARVLENHGLAVILPESELSYPHLLTSLAKVKKLAGKPLNLPKDAGHVMVQSLLADLG